MSRLDYIKKLKNILSDCKTRSEDDARTMARDAFAIVKDRIIQTGIDDDGKKIPGYSEAVVPYWYFKGRGRSERNIEKLKKKGYFVSYKDFRQANNLQTDHVDFFVTGKLWNSFDIVNVTNTGGVVTVLYRPRDDENFKKLGYLIDQKGDWLELNDMEVALLSDIQDKRFQDKFKNAGLL